jgi:hemerythrin-like domain-containing protein
MPVSTPTSVSAVHQDLLQLLVSAQGLQGKTGSVAEQIARMLKPHIEKEEELFLPLLGILPEAADGKLSPSSAKRASKLYAKVKDEYKTMLEEHKSLDRALARLKRVAEEEGHPTATKFAELLKAHSLVEDQILYPAAVLAGRIAEQRARR